MPRFVRLKKIQATAKRTRLPADWAPMTVSQSQKTHFKTHSAAKQKIAARETFFSEASFHLFLAFDDFFPYSEAFPPSPTPFLSNVLF